MNIDETTLIALIALVVSFIALFVTLIQVPSHRNCSAATIGGWASFTRRRWRWDEFRFEILFSTPAINIDPRPAPYYIMQAGEAPQLPPPGATSQCPASDKVDVTGEPEGKQYKLISKSAGSIVGKRLSSPHVQWFDPGDQPWFLSGKKTVAEAKCSWLTLLQATALTTVSVTITEETHSYDYVPGTGYTRPIALVERKSLLTLMSLFGIRWENKGKDRKFAGAGDFCEITVANMPSIGKGFTYHDVLRERAEDPSYHMSSEKARKAMFHCFDFGFATFRTHSNSELRDSIKNALDLPSDKEVVNRVVDYYDGSQEWCPGLSESITCWAEASMPKVVYAKSGKFKSMFSAVSARCLTTGTPQFVAMLLGGEIDHKYLSRGQTIASIKDVTNWAKEYFCHYPLVAAKVKECLQWAATWSPSYQNNIVDPDIPWSLSLECLSGVLELDRHLEMHLLNDLDEKNRNDIKSTICSQQIRYGSSLFQDATKAAQTKGSRNWLDELDRVGAENYVKVVTDITDKFLQMQVGGDLKLHKKLAQNIIVNRLMRGSLWVIHNGNAPDQYKRVAECSLSSSWLEDDSTVHLF